MNLPSATVSMQVVIGLCKRKETAALNFLYSNPPSTRLLYNRHSVAVVFNAKSR